MSSVVEFIRHYQRRIERHPNDETVLLHCLTKLNRMNVKVSHLQETGVGRLINSLRKVEGKVGDDARALVNKWKEMVTAEDEEEESDRSEDKEEEEKEEVEEDAYEIERGSEDAKENTVHHEQDKERKTSRTGDKVHSGHKKGDRGDPQWKTSGMSSERSKEVGRGSMSQKDEEMKSRRESEKRKHKHDEGYKLKEKQVKSDDCESGRFSCENGYDSSPSRLLIPDECSVRATDVSRKRSHEVSEIESSPDRKLAKQETNKNREKSHSYDKKEKSGKDSSSKMDVKNREREKHSYEGQQRKEEKTSHKHSSSHSVGSTRLDHTSDKEKHKHNKDKINDTKCKVKIPDEAKFTDKHRKKELADGNRVTVGKDRDGRKEKEKKKHEESSMERERGREKSKHKHEETRYKEKSWEVRHGSDNRDKHNKVKEKDKLSVDSSHDKHHSEKDKKEDKTQKDSGKSKSSKERLKIREELSEGIDHTSGASFADVLGIMDPVSVNKSKSVSSTGKSKQKSSEKNQDKRKQEEKSVQEEDKRKKEHRQKRKEQTESYRESSASESTLLDTSVKEKLPSLDLNLASTLPEITPNYKPLPHYSMDSPPHKRKELTQEEALTSVVSSRNCRTKMYSGTKSSGLSSVPTLYECCIRVLQDNINDLEYTGGVPYDILKPILERATPQQLYTLEHYNSYLVEDTDQLWQFHVQREFRNKKPEELETAREMYLRCFDEREARLKALTANIQLSMAKTTQVRQTKLAYVNSVAKPPRNVARAQAKHGTGLPVEHAMTAGPPGKATPRPTAGAINAAAATSSFSSRPSTAGAKVKPKVAPLMQKTLKLMKSHFKR